MPMRVVIAGATGFIGKALSQRLHENYEVIALSRDANRAARILGDLATIVEWDGRTAGSWVRWADGALAIINLAGENVAAWRWDESKKSTIQQSRLSSIRAIIKAIKLSPNKPRVVIQASAIGYYGPRGDEQLDEMSPAGKGFLADVCRRSEDLAGQIRALGVRCVIIRTGVVLGTEAGALPRLMRPYKVYLGGHLGSAKQWFSWISLDDEVAAIKFLMDKENLEGVFNLTSPQPVTMKEFCKVLGKVLRRPAWVTVPGFMVRLAFGEMAKEMLLTGQRVIPRRLLEAGFGFKSV
jgi:uncharacterized protein (TIGR01777 family)